MMASFASAILFFPGVRHMVRVPRDSSRLVVISVLPQAAALFGFAAAFLILGPRTPDSGSTPLSVENGRLSSLYMIGGSLAAPLMAWAVITVWKFESLERWKRAIIAGVGVEIVLLVAFALSFLTLRAG